MKISASIYSSHNKDLTALVKELDAYRIDYLHIDCNDDISVFDDISKIRETSNTPIDLHLITSKPEKYYKLIQEHNVEMVTFQYENLDKIPQIPDNTKTKYGLAIVSETEVDVFDEINGKFSFILFMATTPGKSGGVFNRETFRKIRKFRAKYPSKKIHIDGGINEELSFILRNMGVYAVVTGSFLFKEQFIGSAIMKLKSDDIKSRYFVGDFMLEKDEIPYLVKGEYNFIEALQLIEDYRMGFTHIIDKNGVLEGIISNADVRRSILKGDFNNNLKYPELIINKKPAIVKDSDTISEMLDYIKNLDFPILFLPVVDNEGRLCGTVKFNNLIKGESWLFILKKEHKKIQLKKLH